MPLKSIKILGATAMCFAFVFLGIYLFNKDNDYSMIKIVGLANILFFGFFSLLGLYTTMKGIITKKNS